MQEQVATYQTRFALEDESPLNAYGELYGKLERKLFADLMAKKSYIANYKITARQFNSLHFSLKGKIQSAKVLQKEREKELSSQIENLVKKLKKAKGRRLFTLNGRIARLGRKLQEVALLNKEGRVSLCFGGKKLFKAQFQREDLDEWKKEWKAKRGNSFFTVGSKDETSGNQSCTLGEKDGKLFLRVRLPHKLEKEYGKYLLIENLFFAYGEEKVRDALEENKLRSLLQKAKDPSYLGRGTALSYRFVKDHKGWRVFVSLALKPKELLSKKELGVIGIDINADHLALAETDRFGNKVYSEKIPLHLYGKSKEQALALIGDASAYIIAKASQAGKPLAIEHLDFQRKKKSLKEVSSKKARALSSFSYNKVITHLKARAYREGVEVLEVNPAYTSMLGNIKYAKPLGLSVHTAAAYVIGRRGLGFFEKLPFGQKVSLLTKGATLLFEVPERNPRLDKVAPLRGTFKKYKAAHVAHFKAVSPVLEAHFKR